MRSCTLFLLASLVAGCALPATVAQKPLPETSVVVAAVAPTKRVETRYDVRGYREAADPSLRHEAHAVYRQTRVPLAASDSLETVPRTAYPLASVTPLPPSEELAAELATQKKLTAEMRALQASVADVAQKMQAQYALLVRQSAETMKLREQLETERQQIGKGSPTESTPSSGNAPTLGNTPSEINW